MMCGERGRSSWNAEDGAGGQRVKPSAPLNVGQARWPRRHEAIAEAELLTQRHALRFLDQQRVGAAVDRVAVNLSLMMTPPARLLRSRARTDASPRQLECCSQPGDAAADDRQHIDVCCGQMERHRDQNVSIKRRFENAPESTARE